MNDIINHPVHYTQGIEVYDFIESHKMSFAQGNVIKYVSRYQHKNGVEDLKKAGWYLDKLIGSDSIKLKDQDITNIISIFETCDLNGLSDSELKTYRSLLKIKNSKK